MTNISQALQNLRPGAKWTWRGTSYDGLEWVDETQTKPTEDEISQEIERLWVEHERTQYQRQRKPEYPSITDQLDAIWKGGDAYDVMLAKVMAIKDKYPKPE
jgi:hypothetical protein